MLPDWEYIPKGEPGYTDRIRSNSGNCLDYAMLVKRRLRSQGLDADIWYCKVDGSPHAAVVLDDEFVYSVGMSWVVRKDELPWEWISKVE